MRYARWDLARAWLWDEVSGVVLAPLFPLDKSKNADAQRRAVTPPAPSLPVTPDAPAIPPLMQSLLDRYKATGLPPAYLPKKEDDQ